MKIVKSILPLVSFVLASLPKVSADINDDTDDAKSIAAPAVAVASLATIGLGAEGFLIKDLKGFEEQSLSEAFKSNTFKHPLLSILSGVAFGVGAWISPWANFTQSTVFGLAVAALNETASEVKLFFKAREILSPEPENKETTGNSVALIQDAVDENLLGINPGAEDGEQDNFARLIRNNSVIKILALWSAGIALEAGFKYSGMGQAEGYFSAEQAAIAAPIVVNSIWSAISRSRITLPLSVTENLTTPLIQHSRK